MIYIITKGYNPVPASVGICSSVEPPPLLYWVNVDKHGGLLCVGDLKY